ncbi:hypothetical protein [Aliikangiella sp. IMCC44632]
MKIKLKFWLLILVSHLVLAVIPNYIFDNQLTAIIPYHSVVMPLEIFKLFGLPVYGQIEDHMFMAPITFLGWCLLAFFWLIIHYGVATLIIYLIKRLSKGGRMSTG